MAAAVCGVVAPAGVRPLPAHPVGSRPPCLLPPVAGHVVDPFREPGCPWCAGNRGIEYATVPGSVVRAAAPGRVGFAGVVAGVRYVVVDHDGAHRTTYGRLRDATVGRGDVVQRGAALGWSGSTFFFGLRRGETYLDPAPWSATVVPRPQLVPLDGRGRRSARAATWSCPGLRAAPP